MPYYCVNKNSQPGSGDHEVHDLGSTKGCLPDRVNQIALGFHSTCVSAVREARRYYTDVNGCYWCTPGCHTT